MANNKANSFNPKTFGLKYSSSNKLLKLSENKINFTKILLFKQNK